MMIHHSGTARHPTVQYSLQVFKERTLPAHSYHYWLSCRKCWSKNRKISYSWNRKTSDLGWFFSEIGVPISLVKWKPESRSYLADGLDMVAVWCTELCSMKDVYYIIGLCFLLHQEAIGESNGPDPFASATPSASWHSGLYTSTLPIDITVLLLIDEWCCVFKQVLTTGILYIYFYLFIWYPKRCAEQYKHFNKGL